MAHAPTPSRPAVTVIVPVFDEVESLDRLHGELRRALDGLGRSFEILYVDDGSRDGSAELLQAIAVRDHSVRPLHLRRNFGKSSALAAGFERARGDIVITLDADLQDDPALIPDFVARIDAGADLVSGWKKERHDPWSKTISSRLFNLVVRVASGVPLRDFNCGFKAYRIDCVRELSVYGGFHRFLPVLASERGFRVEELVVRHRSRAHGRSKYGHARIFDGLLDLLTVLLVTRFRTRPLHFFGIPGGLLGTAGLGILVYLTVIWFSGEKIGTRPLLQLGVLLTITGGQFLAIGLLAELLVRTTVTSREIVSIRAEGIEDDRSHGRAPASEPPAVAPSLSEVEAPSSVPDRLP